ncbi:MAG: SH3 domain-containing protein [Candidatus Promineifilaceae bacterium]|jgi:hypothetical protein
MEKARVIEEHAPVHEQVLKARAGERLHLEREDDEWPGWIWCVTESGTGSWVPEPYLAIDSQEGVLLQDYEATELTVQPGDLLTLHYEVNGWWWTADSQGNEGWVPAKKTEPLLEANQTCL